MSLTGRWLLFMSVALPFSAGCSGTVSSSEASSSGTAGTSAASGARSANGGTSANGAAPNSGGTTPAPGSGAGTASGGLTSAGGVSATGGVTATGGAASAGSPPAGGAVSNAGAQSLGGANANGGVGGAQSGAGGKTSAGASSISGAGAGGSAGLGGAARGGSESSGGAAPTGGSGGSGGNPFKGVANSACADLTTLKASWWYNWMTSPGTCSVREFVPMVSGKNEKTAAAVASAVTQIGNAGHKTLLGFNEPNKVDQSNMSVAQVLGLWPSLTSNTAIRVGSAATSADAQTQFTDFMSQVTSQSLRVDFIAVHWYGWNAGSCDARALELENYIKWAEAIPGNRPIWITEWGCMHLSNPDRATVQAFFSGALAMFARHPRIERYAWYPWNTHSELVETSGALTPLGRLFAEAPSYK